MGFITAYTPKLREITPMANGMGFDTSAEKFKKFKGEYKHWEVLDALTAAVEAGKIDDQTWVSTVFSSKSQFKQFLEDLEGWSDTERLHDRWALAILAITQNADDEYVVTGREAADTLLSHAEETHQI